MFSVSCIGKSAFAIGLLLAFACNSPASDDGDVAKELASLGVECDYDDDGNVIGVDFGYHPLATAADLSLSARNGSSGTPCLVSLSTPTMSF